MRKILLVSTLILLLSGCSLWNKETNFTSLYSAYVVAPIDTLENFAQYVGYNRQEEITGALKWAVEIPVLLSWAFSSDYTLGAFDKDGIVSLENMKGVFESIVNTSTFEAKKMSLMTIGGDLYVLYDTIKTSLLPPEAMTVFDKYNNTWLSYTEADMNAAFSWDTMEDELSRIISQNISDMTLDDVRTYLTEYPILKEETMLSASGTKQAYEVSLDKDKLVELIAKVQSDLTDKSLSDTDLQWLKDGIAGISLTGTVVFDTENTQFIDLNLAFSNLGSPVTLISLSTDTDKQMFSVESLEMQTKAVLSANQTPENKTCNIVLSQAGTEMANMTINIALKDKKLQKLTLDLMAQGVSVSLEHARTSDTAFEWRLILPVGTLSWNGSLDDDRLTSMSLKWATPMGSIDMNLIQDGDKLRWPLVIKQWSEEILRANIGLLSQTWIFGFDIDVANPTASGSSLKANIDVSYDKKSLSKKFSIPSNTLPLENLTKELEALVPADDSFMDESMDQNDIVSPNVSVDNPTQVTPN